MNVLMSEAVKLSQDQLVMDLVTKGVHIGIVDKHFTPLGQELGGWELEQVIRNCRVACDLVQWNPCSLSES